MILIIVGSPLSGKTTLLNKLKEKGVDVFSADLFIKEIYKQGNKGFETIKDKLGKEFVNEHGVDRNALSL